MMPRTSDRAVDHEPLNEWTAIVSAAGSDREEFATNPRQQHFLATDVAEQRGSVREFVLRKAKGEIRTPRFGMIQHFFSFKGRGRVGARRFRHFQLSSRSLRRQRVHVNIS